MADDRAFASRYRVVAFDLDGTLLRGTAVSLVLANAMGHREAIVELDRRFVAREISNREFADASAEWFTGIDPDDLWVHLAEAPWITGLDATVKTLLSAGCDVLLCTITWRFVAQLLQREHGFHAVSGTEMELEGQLLSGRVSRYFDPDDKVRFVESWCEEREIALAQVAAVGDSRLDVPLFSRVGCSIALNATADARGAAHHCLDTDDLTDVLNLLAASR